jgi:hypothetical protein
MSIHYILAANLGDFLVVTWLVPVALDDLFNGVVLTICSGEVTFVLLSL